MDKLRFETVKVKLSQCVGYDKNPRTIANKKKSELIRSLQDFWLVELPVLDFDHTIVSGHQRIGIMRALYGDDQEIEVRFPNRKMTEKEFQGYNIIANKRYGEFDVSMLNAHFDKAFLIELGFTSRDLEIKGPKWDGDEVEWMALKGFEKYDYLMFLCDNEMDWLNVQQVFGIKKIDYGFDGIKKIGLGRVLPMSALLKKIRWTASEQS